MKRFLVNGAVLASLTAALFPAVGPSASAEATTTLDQGKVQAWSPQHMGGSTNLTLTQALKDAGNFDYISAQQATYHNYVSQMHAQNPNLKLLVYINSSFTYYDTLPEAMYAHSSTNASKANRIKQKGQWSSTYLMNIADGSGWSTKLSQLASGLISSSGYDGLYLDVLGPAPLSTSYVTALPINPATGKVWTQTDWLRQTTKLASAVKTSLAPRVVVGNGLQMGSRYFASTAPTGVLVNASTRGLIPEAWVRAATQSLTSYRALTAWQQDVNMLRDSGSKGVGVFTITKTWASGTQAQKDALYKYALASYLLGNDGTAWFFFSYNNVANDSTVRLPHNYDDYGPAKGAYYLAQNVYQRDFSKGKALVNPSGNTYTVSLGGTYYTWGRKAVSQVTLAPHTAEILTTS